MRFTVDHADFAPALASVSRVVPSRSVRPVLSSVLVEARDGHLTLAATDLETAAVTTVAAAIDEEGRVAVPCRYLTEMMRRIPGGNLFWQSDKGDAGVRISWAKSQFAIHGYAAGEYPPIPSFPATAERTLPQGLLRHAIQHTAFAAAQGETARALLTGVEIRFTGSSLFALATDGFQVAAYSTDTAATRPSDSGIVVPAAVLQEVARTLGDGDDPCDIAQQGNQILFRAGATYLVARLLEGKYFAVLDLVPKQFPTVVHVQRDVLLGACERVGLISDNEPPYAVVLSVTRGGLELNATSPDVGTAEEQLEVQVDGPEVRLGFNGRQLTEGLRRLGGAQIRIEISGATTLTRFTDPVDGRLQFMQMPLQMPG